MKELRITDEKLLARIRKLPCVVCQIVYQVTHAHHVKSKKSGGHDVPENVMPLCPKHHVEVHQYGIYTMSTRYFHFKNWLLVHGWEMLDGKWRRCEATRTDENEPVQNDALRKNLLEAK